jgi:endosialidase-like protein
LDRTIKDQPSGNAKSEIMKTEFVRSLVPRLPNRRRFIVLLVALGCGVFSRETLAVSPAPDGSYPNGNTAEGNGALFSLTNGFWNTALGQQTLYHDTSGNYNTAVGVGALFKNATAPANNATGFYALFSNTTGYYNTADGFEALTSNTTGFRNAAVGAYTLYHHVSGNYNNAVGAFALHSDTTGSTNNAFGESALAYNRSGADNTAIGDDALWSNTSGDSNIALGSGAGRNLTTGSYNIDIGNPGVAGESSTTRIGTSGKQTRTFMAGIYGVREGGAISPVYINSNGQLGTQAPPSSRRFKKKIKSMDRKSEAILALQPVTFYYKSDNTNTPQFGLVAEDVAKVNPDLVVRDDNGEIYTVRYEAVNAMLLNEFLKEHRKVQKLEREIADQRKEFGAATQEHEKEIKVLTAVVREQVSQIQKVSAQLGMRNPEPQTVLNNQPVGAVHPNRRGD